MSARLDPLAARATAQSLDEMLAELDRLPESRARSLALDMLDAVVLLYGEGLARLVSAHRDDKWSDSLLVSDELLSRLLSVHDLLPRTTPTLPLVQIERRNKPASDGVALDDAETQCQLCAAPIRSGHRHLLDVDKRQLVCSCSACAVLFDGRGPSGARYRLIPQRYRPLERSMLDDGLWERLELPVDVVFMFLSSHTGEPVAFYPGPMGTTESALSLPAWSELLTKSPLLATLAPDVEAVLVRRTRGARDYWILPVDECYRLAGIMRAKWRGISGGDDVRRAVDAFFRRLAARTTGVANHIEEAPCPTT